MSAAAKQAGAIPYKKGSYFLVERQNRVGKRIALRSTLDMSKTEVSHRMYRPQKEWYAPHYKITAPKRLLPFRVASKKYSSVDVPVIKMAFDVPERITILLRDKHLTGADKLQLNTPAYLEEVIHWLREARYWRSIGITAPFMDGKLRADRWRQHGTDTGTIAFSRVMQDAVKDLERAVKRKEQGLAPNYVWDNWGPMGTLDGSRTDFLPRMPHNPYLDPDGVRVSNGDIQTYTTHEQLKERYAEFINPDEATYAGAFLAPSNAGVSIADVADGSLVEYYVNLQKADGVAESNIDLTNVSDLRLLVYIAGNDKLRDKLSTATKWSEVKAAVDDEQMARINLKVDFARLLHNTRDDITRLRRFYEEKCGFRDFMLMNDKAITGAVINCIQDMHRMVSEHSWARAMLNAKSELEWQNIMGSSAFSLYRNVEECILDKRRRTWATRFSGEANEEKALDYLLENFGRRTGKVSGNQGTTNAEGAEYDREYEPVGRNIQRRVLGSDKKQTTVKRKGRHASKAYDPLAHLHRQQLQRATNFGVH